MDLGDIVKEQPEEDVTRQCHRVVVAVLAQAFAYTVASEFGCIITGEAFTFLRIPQSDYSQLCYASSCPRRQCMFGSGVDGIVKSRKLMELNSFQPATGFHFGSKPKPSPHSPVGVEGPTGNWRCVAVAGGELRS